MHDSSPNPNFVRQLLRQLLDKLRSKLRRSAMLKPAELNGFGHLGVEEATHTTKQNDEESGGGSESENILNSTLGVGTVFRTDLDRLAGKHDHTSSAFPFATHSTARVRNNSAAETTNTELAIGGGSKLLLGRARMDSFAIEI
ncbi:hypothetical protein C8F04DRAFT_1184567 [Mycena alexandri]|uniref:Uncharacterized protein n=1 Tax=Mycena alexandri TaxID=1745969 RepID=A0AAD6X198_9AGAR|nr:hypothetical protein C8F04DRAFT_1184567 [Mycena alexandri]